MKYITPEVAYVEEAIAPLGQQDIAALKMRVHENERHRIRICTHLDVQDSLHEMFIVHVKDAYIRPHKHLNKPESLLVLEGTATLIIFDDEGTPFQEIQLGDYLSGKQCYCRVSQPLYHTLFITSEYFVYHEVTTGPFVREETVFAPWAPAEDDTQEIARFLELFRQTS
jgi:cupin fold WbuC family metalloprotein